MSKLSDLLKASLGSARFTVYSADRNRYPGRRYDSQRQTEPVPTGKFRSAIGECVRPRGNRHLAQKALEIIRHRDQGRISLGRVFFQHFPDDRVEVTPQLAAKFFDGGAALPGGSDGVDG